MNEAGLTAILDSLKEPILFVDPGHVICYANKAAIAIYKRLTPDLVGESILDCHSQRSGQKIVDTLACFTEEDEERLLYTTKKYQVFMRVVRDSNQTIIGYYERFVKIAP